MRLLWKRVSQVPFPVQRNALSVVWKSSHVSDDIKGILVRAVLGAIAGLGVAYWSPASSPLTMIGVGAVSCGALAYFFGDAFLEFVRAVIRLWHL